MILKYFEQFIPIANDQKNSNYGVIVAKYKHSNNIHFVNWRKKVPTNILAQADELTHLFQLNGFD